MVISQKNAEIGITTEEVEEMIMLLNAIIAIK